MNFICTPALILALSSLMHLSFAADSKHDADDAAVSLPSTQHAGPLPTAMPISSNGAAASMPAVCLEACSKLDQIATGEQQMNNLAEMQKAIAENNVEALGFAIKCVWMTDEVKAILISALPLAARRGSLEMVQVMMPYLKPFWNDMNNELVAVFRIAAETGDLAIVNYLVDQAPGNESVDDSEAAITDVNFLLYEEPNNAHMANLEATAIVAARHGNWHTAEVLVRMNKIRSMDHRRIIDDLLGMAIEAGDLKMMRKFAAMTSAAFYHTVDVIPDYIGSRTTDQMIAFLEQLSRPNPDQFSRILQKILESAIVHNHQDLVYRLLDEHIPNLGVQQNDMIGNILYAALSVNSEKFVWEACDHIPTSEYFWNMLFQSSMAAGRLNIARGIVEVRFPEIVNQNLELNLLLSARCQRWDLTRYMMQLDYESEWRKDFDNDAKIALDLAVEQGQLDIILYLHSNLFDRPNAEDYHPNYLRSVRHAQSVKVFDALDGILQLYTDDSLRQELVFEALQIALKLEEPEAALWAISRLTRGTMESRLNESTVDLLLRQKNMEATIRIIGMSILNLQAAKDFWKCVTDFWDQETGVLKPATILSMNQLFLMTPWNKMSHSSVRLFANVMLSHPWFRKIPMLSDIITPNLLHLGAQAMIALMDQNNSCGCALVAEQLVGLNAQKMVDAAVADQNAVVRLSYDAVAQSAGAGTEPFVGEEKKHDDGE